MGTSAVVKMDGRRARSAKTREAIVDATLSLLAEGELQPPTARIAERAGISVRSVFQHFADLEDLFLAVTDKHTNRVAELYTGTNYEGDLSARVDTFVGYRSRLYETVSPMRRAGLITESSSKAVAVRMELARELDRLDLERAFPEELAAVRERGDLATPSALAAITSFVAWTEMRRFAGLDVPAAEEALRVAVVSLLQAALPASR